MKKAVMMREKGSKKVMVNHGLKGPRCTGTCPQTSGKFEGTVVSASPNFRKV